MLNKREVVNAVLMHLFQAGGRDEAAGLRQQTVFIEVGVRVPSLLQLCPRDAFW